MKRRIFCLFGLCFLALWMSACSQDKKTVAEGAANNWLKLVDSGNYAQSWDDTGTVLKANVGRDQWQEVLLRNRAPLGALISRKLRSAEYTTTLPGAPDGQYVVLQYESSFEHKNAVIETVTPMLDKDAKWRVSLYIIK
jgi:cbb3-type cytochrome oxidase subunit 3